MDRIEVYRLYLESERLTSRLTRMYVVASSDGDKEKEERLLSIIRKSWMRVDRRLKKAKRAYGIDVDPVFASDNQNGEEVNLA